LLSKFNLKIVSKSTFKHQQLRCLIYMFYFTISKYKILCNFILKHQQLRCNLFAFILPFTIIKYKRMVHRIHTSKFIVRVLPHNVYTDISKYCVYNIDWPDKKIRSRSKITNHCLLKELNHHIWMRHNFQKWRHINEQ